jgi:hypothetical protein
MSPFQNAGPSRWVTASQFFGTKLFSASTFFSRKMANIGEIADYIQWGQQRFGAFRPLRRREQLWGEMIKCLPSAGVRGFEFGVAWGYGSEWWLSKIEDPQFRWDGFDRFTGLPREWRNLPEGTFNANGRPPSLSDDRVTWHVGNLEDRIRDLDLYRNDDETWVVLFDLDVFEPSLVAWEYLKPSLRPDDLLYFDEAFDRDERHLLDHHILTSGNFSLIGATPLALCLRVENIITWDRTGMELC